VHIDDGFAFMIQVEKLDADFEWILLSFNVQLGFLHNSNWTNQGSPFWKGFVEWDSYAGALVGKQRTIEECIIAQEKFERVINDTDHTL
jgi:hypothetical protein